MGKKRETKKDIRDQKIWDAYNQRNRELREKAEKHHECGLNPERQTKKSIYMDVAEICDCSPSHVGDVVRARFRSDKCSNECKSSRNN